MQINSIFANASSKYPDPITIGMHPDSMKLYLNRLRENNVCTFKKILSINDFNFLRQFDGFRSLSYDLHPSDCNGKISKLIKRNRCLCLLKKIEIEYNLLAFKDLNWKKAVNKPFWLPDCLFPANISKFLKRNK